MQLHSIQDELEGFRAEAEVLLPWLRRGRPAECALLKAFGGAPHAGAVEVEQFQPGMGFVDKEMQPGQYKLPFNAADLASGIYFYNIKMGNYQSMKKQA